jgi:urease accessory protein
VPTAGLARSDGYCGLRFSGSSPERQLRLLDQTPPCRVLFPRPEEAGVEEAAIVTTTGGLAGGDRLRFRLEAEQSARVSITTQAAEKVYRTTGDRTLLDVDLSVTGQSRMEWFPQETILFNRSRFVRNTSVDLEPGSAMVIGEMTIFGRTEHGETDPEIDLLDRWRVRRNGQLVWAENFGFSGRLGDAMQSAARLEGARATAMLLATGPVDDDLLGKLRELTVSVDGITGGVTVIDDLLVCRMTGRRPHILRKLVINSWREMRQSVLEFGPRLPRVWSV